MNGMFQEGTPKSGEMDESRAQKTRDGGQKKIDFWLLSSSSVDLHQSDDCDGSDEGKKKKKKKLRRVHSEGASESVKMNLRSSSSSTLSSCSSETVEKVDVASGMLVGNRKELERKSRSSSVSSHGSVSLCGRRRAMEDAVTVAPGLNFSEKLEAFCDFFGVYDGHGGCVVAHVCRDRLHRILANEIETEAESLKAERKGPDEIDWEKIMTSCFLKMDDEIRQKGAEMESINSTGSTAVVALVSADKIIVANCGDSRAVLSRGGVVVPLSHDHKPDRPDEMERVEAAGGNVINWNGYRILGVLATSRSIGDQYLKPFVISEPEVTVTERKDEDEFLILASDGLWDVMPNEIACDIIRRFLDIARKKRRFEDEDVDDIILRETWNADQAAAMLAGLAMARGSRDNISVVVVELKHCRQRMIP